MRIFPSHISNITKHWWANKTEMIFIFIRYYSEQASFSYLLSDIPKHEFRGRTL